MSSDLVAFEPVYRAHVASVVAGDLTAVMADMDPESLSRVFDGVEVPRSEVQSAHIVRVHVVGNRGVGEAVYRTATGLIGLRSGWRQVGGRWLADALENFAPMTHQP